MTLRWLNPWRDLRGLPRDSWTLAIVTVINRVGTMVLPFLMLHLTKNLGIEPARAGLTLGGYGVAALITAPVAGRLSDRIGSARMLKSSLFATAILMWILPLARGWGAVSALIFLLGIAAEAFRPASMALVGDLAGQERRRQGFALNRLAINLGMSVGPALGGVLAMSSFRSLFWVNGATSMLAGAVLFGWPIQAGGPHPRGHAAPGVRLGEEPGSHARLMYFLVALLPVVLVFFQHEGTMPLFMVQELGFNEAVYGSMFTINTVLIVLLEVRLNGATAHWPHRRSLAVAAALCGAGFGAFALARSLGEIVAGVVIWTVAEMILFPSASAYVTEIAPPGRRGEYLGYYSMFFGIGFAIGPATGTAVMQRFGSTTLWGLCFVLGLVAAVLMARLPIIAAAAPGGSVQPEPSAE
ncbi:MAG TPA: MFS transporter [Myxococcaceae bacterium]|nr:MFS transporter [Myxococcaceae bacterium]